MFCLKSVSQFYFFNPWRHHKSQAKENRKPLDTQDARTVSQVFDWTEAIGFGWGFFWTKWRLFKHFLFQFDLKPAWKTEWYSHLSLSSYLTLCPLKLLPSPVFRIQDSWLQDLAASDRNRPAKNCQIWRINSNSKGWPWGQGMWMGVSYSGSMYSPKALKNQEGLLEDDGWLSLSRWAFLYIFGIRSTPGVAVLLVAMY